MKNSDVNSEPVTKQTADALRAVKVQRQNEAARAREQIAIRSGVMTRQLRRMLARRNAWEGLKISGIRRYKANRSFRRLHAFAQAKYLLSIDND